MRHLAYLVITILTAILLSKSGARAEAPKDRFYPLVAYKGLTESDPTESQPPNEVTIAVIDAPVDINHPQIAKFVDLGTMNEGWFINFDGTILNWHSWAERLLVNAAENGQIGYFYHGTHVAGVAVKALRGIRLIAIPFLMPRPERTALEQIHFDPDRERFVIRQNFTNMTTQFKAKHVRLANLSIGVSPGRSYEKNKFKVPRWSLRLRSQLKEALIAADKIYLEEYEKWIHDNPETLFVNAVANNGEDLADVPYGTSRVKAPNLIKVGATNQDQTFRTESDRSNQFVDVAAPGENIYGPIVGANVEHPMSGTSVAAPQVVNALALKIGNEPDLTVAQIKQFFFAHFTWSNPDFANYVQNGRTLMPVKFCRDYFINKSDRK